MKRYLFEKEITVENLRQFVNDFENKRLNPAYISTPTPVNPANWEI